MNETEPRTPAGRAQRVLISATICLDINDSRSLTDSQRFAADFKPGSHLEEGEFVRDGYVPSEE